MLRGANRVAKNYESGVIGLTRVLDMSSSLSHTLLPRQIGSQGKMSYASAAGGQQSRRHCADSQKGLHHAGKGSGQQGKAGIHSTSRPKANDAKDGGKQGQGHLAQNSQSSEPPPQQHQGSTPPAFTGPKEEHKPNTQQEEECVYVLTMKLTPSISDPINQLRRTWFPKKLNRTPAHLTLFHALPHSRISTIEADLEDVAARTMSFGVQTGRVFRMRRGVGIRLGRGVKSAQGVHERLRGSWEEWLSEQDVGSSWRPHWTVMNKINEEETVQEGLDEVEGELRRSRGISGEAVGLDLWRYDRGRWVWSRDFRFEGNGE